MTPTFEASVRNFAESLDLMSRDSILHQLAQVGMVKVLRDIKGTLHLAESEFLGIPADVICSNHTKQTFETLLITFRRNENIETSLEAIKKHFEDAVVHASKKGGYWINALVGENEVNFLSDSAAEAQFNISGLVFKKR